MSYLEMTEIAGGAREPSAAGTPYGAAAGILGQPAYNYYTPGQPLPSTPIEDAAL
jgi:hypothetical protein